MFSGGCAPSVRSASSAAAEGAVPAAAGSALTTLEDQRTRARVAAVLGTPEMQQAMQELSGGLTHGIVNGLSSDEMNAQMTKLVGRFTRTFMSELARGMEHDLAPAMGAAIDTAMDTAMSPAHQQQIDRLTATVVAAAMRGLAQEIPQSLAPAMHKAMTDDVGPALGEMMREGLAPALTEVFRSPELKKTLGETAREVAHQGVLGSNEGLAELAEKKKREQGGSPLGSFFAPRMWLLGALIVAAVLALPLLWLIRERRLAARYHEQAERRTARAAALLGAMEAAPDGTWSSKMLDMLRAELLEQEERATEGRAKEEPAGPRSGPGHQPRHA
jgi:hypothetical protein